MSNEWVAGWRQHGPGRGLVAVVALMAGCASPAAVGGSAIRSSAGPRVSATSSQPDAADPCTTPNTVVTRHQPPGGPLRGQDKAVGAGPFAGSWHVHDGNMVLRTDGTGTQSFAAGGDPVEVDTIVGTYYRNPDRLLVHVTSVSFLSGDPASAIPAPTDACSKADGGTAAGDEQLLRFAAPHLLISSVVVSHLAPINLDGNPYWCQPGLATELQERCGA